MLAHVLLRFIHNLRARRRSRRETPAPRSGREALPKDIGTMRPAGRSPRGLAPSRGRPGRGARRPAAHRRCGAGGCWASVRPYPAVDASGHGRWFVLIEVRRVFRTVVVSGSYRGECPSECVGRSTPTHRRGSFHFSGPPLAEIPVSDGVLRPYPHHQSFPLWRRSIGCARETSTEGASIYARVIQRLRNLAV